MSDGNNFVPTPGSTSISTSINETFTKAALYQQCSKSNILKHIDLKTVDVNVMRDLINRENLLNIRKLPIIFSKLVVKMGLEFACDKFPRAGTFIQPKQIRVDVEDDEMEFLLSTNSSFKPNLVFIVSKNIALSVLGDSVASLRTKLMEAASNTANTEKHVPVIQVNVPATDPIKFTPPQTYTSILGDPMSPRSGSIKPLKRLNNSLSSKSSSSKSSRSNRRNSVASSTTSSVASNRSKPGSEHEYYQAEAQTKEWVNAVPVVEEQQQHQPVTKPDLVILENKVLTTLNDVLSEAPEDLADGKIELPMDKDFYNNKSDQNSNYSFEQDDDMDVDDDDDNQDDDDEMVEPKLATVDTLKSTDMQPGSMDNLETILDLISVKNTEFSFLKNVEIKPEPTTEPLAHDTVAPKPRATKASSVKSISIKRKQYDDDDFGFP